MGKKKVKNKRNSELKVIFFVILVAAALFIVSTYAWFTTQRNISITNLNGKVEVADGLEVSLNAKNWSSQIVLGTEEGQYRITGEAADYGPYDGHRNISPSEMLPVSTLGKVENSTMKDITMLRGKVTNLISLGNIVAMDETKTADANDPQFPGYFAFDIFLKNTSKTNNAEVLQLNYDSSLQTTEIEKSETGLQNTTRIAFARYGSIYDEETGTWTGVSSSSEKEQATILKETGAGTGADDVYITDVAIWEPNSNDHVDYIVDNNNKITWATEEATTIFGDGEKRTEKFTTTTQIPTFALTSNALNKEIDDIYNWDGNTYLRKQVTLQTTKTSDTDYSISEGVQDLISTSDATGATKLTIAPNSIIRLRVYVWLEGQDVDCINYASHGGGITLNLGLVKGSTPNTHY